MLVINDPVFNNRMTGISVGNGSSLSGNNVRGNGNGEGGGYGMSLGTDATYRGNTTTDNATGALTAGVLNMGDNHCAGTSVASASCP